MLWLFKKKNNNNIKKRFQSGVFKCAFYSGPWGVGVLVSPPPLFPLVLIFTPHNVAFDQFQLIPGDSGRDLLPVSDTAGLSFIYPDIFNFSYKKILQCLPVVPDSKGA